MILRPDIENGRVYEKHNFPSLKEQSDFWYYANDCNYQYGQNSDSLMSKRQGRMVHHIDPDAFVQTSFWKRIEKEVQWPLGLIEAYVNYADFSTLTFPHCDNRENDMSILLCLNQDWHRNWGGFTVFFDGVNSNKVIKTVTPEPGKAVFFNGSTYHMALPPTVNAEYPRFMVALQTTWLKTRQDKK